MDNRTALFTEEIYSLYENSMIPMGICYVEDGRFRVHIVSDRILLST